MILSPIPKPADSPTPPAPQRPYNRDGDVVQGRGSMPRDGLRKSRPLASFGIPWTVDQRRDLDASLFMP